MKRAALVMLATALVATGCTLDGGPDTRGTTSAQPDQNGGGLAWRNCQDTAEELVGAIAARTGVTYQCATVKVPQDWANPNGPTFDIALLRARARSQQNRIGSLLVNPGGPGGSGVDLAVYLSLGQSLGGLPTDVLSRFDLVGFDPRGVSRSSPVKCISDADLDATFGYEPDPADQAQFDGLVDLNKRIGQACGAKYGASLPLYSTEQAARDMDAVRGAVGDEKITYLGYSYGTLLGATYAQLFPTRIRAFVLDGAVDPKQDAIAGSESQAKGFELAFGNFTTWCSQNAARCPIAPDARAAVSTALDKARVSPVRGPDGREATAGWVFYAIVSSLYTESGWAKLASAVQKLETGDAQEVFDLADAYAERRPDGTYSNMFDANSAVNCADENASPSVARIRQLQGQWRAKYPLFGASLAVGMLTCAEWPGKRDPVPTGAATGAPPIVVVGTTGDPATPYEQTARLAGMLGVGVVLTWQGEGHTAYPETACVNNAVGGYLIGLTVPGKGLTCPPR